MPCSSKILRDDTKYLLPQQQWNHELVCLLPWQNIISLTPLRHNITSQLLRLCIYGFTGIGVWQTVYAMLR